MIIIDEYVEKKLAQALKDFLRAPDETGSIYFKFPTDKIHPSRIQAVISESVEKEITSGEQKFIFWPMAKS